jgi:hypothetical protein
VRCVGEKSRGLDVAALNAAETALESAGQACGAPHVQMLQAVLRVHGTYSAAGLQLSAAPQIALLLQVSEHRAHRLLAEASVLASLPGGFAAVESGLLGVERSEPVTRQLAELDLPLRRQVWQRLLDRLRADREAGVAMPAPRLTETLRRWINQADPEAAAARRKQAQSERSVSYRRRDDGLADLFLLGIPAPLAQACLQRIRAHSRPVGSSDERTADQRRLDAAVDLLLGREGQRHRHEAGRSACGCTVGAPAPCGVEVQVLVPLNAALGTTDETAELVGHGPLDREQLRDVLRSAPRLRPVWVDDAGIPVATGRAVQPRRRDEESVRRSLLRLAALPPPPLQPRHPDDHPGGTLHPPDAPGRYRAPRRLRRLLFARRPWCEFPGCPYPAVRCDVEHDRRWPDGPTCACNTGPCCRRHHRVKQEGWGKTRALDAGVDWTAPSGRTWHSPVPHEPPTEPVRTLPSLRAPEEPWDGLDELDRWAQDPGDRYWDGSDPTDDLPDDPQQAQDHDELGYRLACTDTRWTLDLDDPYPWLGVTVRTP